MRATLNRCIIVLIAALANTTVVADPAKLDAGLRQQLECYTATHPKPLASSVEPERVAATVHFTRDGLAAMHALGVTTRSVIGDMATVLIPIDRLAEVAALPQVLRLEAPSRPVERTRGKRAKSTCKQKLGS